MTTLLNKDGSVVPPRPSSDDSEIRTNIINHAIYIVFPESTFNFNGLDKEDLFNLLNKHWYELCDEYQLARDIEGDGWVVNRDLAERLDEVCFYIDSALRELVKVWVDKNNIIQPYQIGEKLDVGVITGCCDYYPATYEVLIYGEPADSTCRRLIKFEDAVPCPLNKHGVI